MTPDYETNLKIIEQREQIAKLTKQLETIRHLSRPGQEISIYQAIDILTDIWNAAAVEADQ